MKKINKIILCIISIIIFLTFIFLFMFNILKTNIIYLIPLFFELITILLYCFKYKFKKKIIIKKIIFIKYVILLITLLIALVSNYFNIQELILKILLTMTVIFQVLVFYKLNKE